MGSRAPDQLNLSGVVFDGIPYVASLGDVRIYPGANRTPFIDASIFDGREWRSLDLTSFASLSRIFHEPCDIGYKMRKIAEVLQKHTNHPVHYEQQGRGRRYIFRGLPFPAHIR